MILVTAEIPQRCFCRGSWLSASSWRLEAYSQRRLLVVTIIPLLISITVVFIIMTVKQNGTRHMNGNNCNKDRNNDAIEGNCRSFLQLRAQGLSATLLRAGKLEVLFVGSVFAENPNMLGVETRDPGDFLGARTVLWRLTTASSFELSAPPYVCIL